MKRIVLPCIAALLILLPGIVTAEVSQADPVTKAEVDSANTGEITSRITINHSGFLREKKTTITYRRSDGKILSVTENGNPVPEEKFERYTEYVIEALASKKYENLKPEIARVKAMIQLDDVPEKEKVDAINALLDSLGPIETSVSSTYSDLLHIYRSLIKVHSFELLREQMKSAMLEENSSFAGTVDSIYLSPKGCRVNGKAVSPALSLRLLELYGRHSGSDFAKRESIKIIFE